ncbi:uncharacterized protein LOC144714325 [Wolffia australiana]
MSYRSVFCALQELFPQIDLRVLKAVALEHCTDVDAAAEFILSEFLPTLDAQRDKPRVSTGSLSHSKLPDSGLLIEGTDGMTYSSISSPDMTLRIDEASLSVSLNEVMLDQRANDFPVKDHKEIIEKDNPVKSSYVPMAQSGEISLQIVSTSESGSYEVEKPFQLSYDHFKSDSASSSPKGSMECENPLNSPALPEKDDLENIPGCSNDFVESPRANSTLQVAEDETIHNVPVEDMNYLRNTDDDPSVFNGEDIVEDDNAATEIEAQSGQIVSVEYLEELLIDCKDIKDFIASEVESILDLARETDTREKEASLAKEEASKASLDILPKVEDLKEMLKHAEEANNMHAGEIYGERSILVTEAKELQSRLLSLSEQRHGTLAITEQIRQTLKARLDTAEKEILESSKDKDLKEEGARRALEEQEAIMNRVVLESKRLHKEAEENSKLAEFLVERGRLVDTLQGEISVICEDVLKLKERVDQGPPLGRSLFSSQVLPSIAASACSSMSSSASDRLPTYQKSSASTRPIEVHGNGDLGSSGDQQGAVFDGNEDDWDYCDGGFQSGASI